MTLLAYLSDSYPANNQTYVQRELAEIERRGTAVMRCSLRGDARSTESDPRAAATWVASRASLLERAIAVANTLISPAKAWRSLRCCLRSVETPVRSWVDAAVCARRWRRAGVRHVHAHFGLESASIARASFLLGGPAYSFTVHGPDEFDDPAGIDLPGKVGDAAFVVAITRFARGQICRWVERSLWDRVHVVGCTVPERFFSEIPIGRDHRSFVFVGRLVAQKGPELLIDAFHDALGRGIDAELVLVGDGPMRPALETRVRDLGIADRVRFAGWLDEDAVRATLVSARALALSSFAEGLPLVCMESFAVGRPVIAPNIAGIPELVKHGENSWLVPCGDVHALADAFEAASRSDASVLNLMAERGRRAVRSRHLTERETGNLASLFDRALGGERVVEESGEPRRHEATITVRVRENADVMGSTAPRPSPAEAA
ncbi:MAG: glycosyltransferase family 4 protein [Planctomycetota bacterium]